VDFPAEGNKVWTVKLLEEKALDRNWTSGREVDPIMDFAIGAPANGARDIKV
jgi:hypothetical protein